MPVIFKESPVSVTLNGIIYNGTYKEQDGQVFVSSAYGSSCVPIRRAKAGLKEAAREMLADIVRNRGR